MQTFHTMKSLSIVEKHDMKKCRKHTFWRDHFCAARFDVALWVVHFVAGPFLSVRLFFIFIFMHKTPDFSKFMMFIIL